MYIENLKFLSPCFALISGIIGLLNLDKLPDIKAKLILFTIWFTFFADLFGTNYYKFFKGENYWFYNIYFLTLFTIYYYIYYLAIDSKNLKKIILFFIALFVICFSIDASCFSDFMEVQLFNSYTIGVLLMCISSFFYLFELLNSKEIINYSRSLIFWFTVGIISFHVSFVPFMYSIKFFLIDYNLKVYSIVLFFLNFVMNFCFSYGLYGARRFAITNFII